MDNNRYQFSRARLSDLPMLRQWLATTEVKKWWGDPEEQAAILQQDLRDSRMAMSMNIVSAEDVPFAYIQDYEVHAWPQNHLKNFAAGTRAIDTFIGLPGHTGIGHGSAYLRQHAENLLAAGAKLVVIDPDAGNARAIRAYEKAGFIQSSIEDSKDGPVVLMRYRPGETCSPSRAAPWNH